MPTLHVFFSLPTEQRLIGYRSSEADGDGDVLSQLLRTNIFIQSPNPSSYINLCILNTQKYTYSSSQSQSLLPLHRNTYPSLFLFHSPSSSVSACVCVRVFVCIRDVKTHLSHCANSGSLPAPSFLSN